MKKIKEFIKNYKKIIVFSVGLFCFGYSIRLFLIQLFNGLSAESLDQLSFNTGFISFGFICSLALLVSSFLDLLKSDKE